MIIAPTKNLIKFGKQTNEWFHMGYGRSSNVKRNLRIKGDFVIVGP
jgi:hypothetical protein